MNGIRRLLASALVALGSPVVLAVAQDRYVDAVNGSDETGDGSAELPWRTITFSLSRMDDPGMRLHVLPGTYDPALGETFPIALRPNVNLLGTDAASTIVRGNGRAVLIADGMPFSIRIERLTITGAPGLPHVGLALRDLTGGYSSIDVGDCVFEGLNFGIVAEAYGLPRVHDCVIRRNLRDGVRVTWTRPSNVAGFRLERNVIELNGLSGVSLTNVVGSFNTEMHPLLIGNVIRGNHRGISCRSGRGVARLEGVFDGNRIEDNLEVGVLVDSSGAPVMPVIVNSVIVGNFAGVASEGTLAAPRLVNDTIVDNQTFGVLHRGIVVATLLNSIVYANGDDVGGRGVVARFYCDIGDEPGDRFVRTFSANPQFVDFVGRDFRLQPTSPCLDAATSDTEGRIGFRMTGLDAAGQPRDYDADRDGLREVDVGAHEYVPDGIGCRFGNFDARVRLIRSLLQVNGSFGGTDREIVADAASPLRLFVQGLPGETEPIPFVLFAFAGEPDATTASPQPFHLGTTCFPTPLTGAGPEVTTLLDSFASHVADRVFGPALFPSAGAPFSFTLPPGHFPAGSTVTFQGFIRNDGSPQGQYAITNAVVVHLQ